MRKKAACSFRMSVLSSGRFCLIYLRTGQRAGLDKAQWVATLQCSRPGERGSGLLIPSFSRIVLIDVSCVVPGFGLSPFGLGHDAINFPSVSYLQALHQESRKGHKRRSAEGASHRLCQSSRGVGMEGRGGGEEACQAMHKSRHSTGKPHHVLARRPCELWCGEKLWSGVCLDRVDAI